jgi:hypothetical protein
VPCRRNDRPFESGRSSAPPECSNQTDLRLTLADLFYGSDLPERPSPTSVRLVCIQTVVQRTCNLGRRDTAAGGQERAEHCFDSQEPELAFLLVRALPDSPVVVVVRDRIELSTFRFSG